MVYSSGYTLWASSISGRGSLHEDIGLMNKFVQSHGRSLFLVANKEVAKTALARDSWRDRSFEVIGQSSNLPLVRKHFKVRPILTGRKRCMLMIINHPIHQIRICGELVCIVVAILAGKVLEERLWNGHACARHNDGDE